MKNIKVALLLNNKNADSKVEYNKNVITSITGNSFFSAPSPTLAAVTAANNTFENANTAAKNGGKSQVSARNAAEAVIDNLMLQLANYVESVANAAAASGGDAMAIINSAGMDYKKGKSASVLPASPQNVTAKTTQNEGEIELRWEKVIGEHVYVLEMTTDPSVVGARMVTPLPGALNPVVWTQMRILTQTKYTVSGLTSGTKYAFHVYAVGSKGYGAFSNTVVGKAL